MATRIERVVLELDDNLSTGMARAAAATALLKRELGGVDGQSTTATRSTRALGDETERFGRRAGNTSTELNSYAGRIKLIAQVAAGLGPALVPIGAIGIPAAAGLAAELVGVGAAAGTAVLAFHGLGGAVGALNKAQLDPTVTNLQAAQLALEKLPESARAFAHELSALNPTLSRLREAAAQGLFPGLEDSLNQLQSRSGDVEKILFRVGTELGALSRDAATSLAGPEWDNFFKFIARELPDALAGLGQAIGSVAHGAAQLFMAFAPLNHDFTGFIIDAANGFDRWASGLAKTQGFTSFIEYLHTNGPIVADAVVAIANAVLKIVEAAAPLGGPILQALTAVANAIAVIADSKAGPAILATVTALSLLARAQATFGKVAQSSWAQAMKGANGYVAQGQAYRSTFLKGSAAAIGLGIAVSGVAEKTHLANTATLALTGSLAGPWGAAAGGAVGLLLDITKGFHQATIDSQSFTSTLNQQTGAITKNTAVMVAQSLEQQGILARAQQFGLSTKQVTGYVLGQKQATDEVTAALAKYDQTQRVVVGRGGNVASTLGGQSTSADSLATALSDARDQSQGLVDGFRRQKDAARAVAGSFDTATTAAERFRTEIDHLNDMLTHRSSVRDYQAAIDALTKSLTDNGTTLDVNTEKGRNNQAALDAIVSSASKVAETLKGSARTQFLEQARKDILEARSNLVGGRQAAEDFIKKLGFLNTTIARPKIYVDGIPKSLAQLEAVAAKLRALHDRTISVTTIRTTGGRVLPGQADGGTVRGTRAPYGDRVLTMLAPGEEVISNRYGQADQHRTLLKAINARRYAEGGTVAASRVTVNVAGSASPVGSNIDYGRMADALSSLRTPQPLYGDVHVTDGYGGFKRAMEQDRAMASLSGVRHG